jgi:hypothetical protein
MCATHEAERNKKKDNISNEALEILTPSGKNMQNS